MPIVWGVREPPIRRVRTESQNYLYDGNLVSDKRSSDGSGVLTPLVGFALRTFTMHRRDACATKFSITFQEQSVKSVPSIPRRAACGRLNLVSP